MRVVNHLRALYETIFAGRWPLRASPTIFAGRIARDERMCYHCRKGRPKA